MSCADIKPVSYQDLNDAKNNKEADASSQKIKDKENHYIEEWRKGCGRKADSPTTGLALSGGGIRSATFSLGILQALASHNLLKKFDYLSTVSGGGYIGSALCWALRQTPPPEQENSKQDEEKQENNRTCLLDKEHFPFGSDDPLPPEYHSKINAENESNPGKYKRQPDSDTQEQKNYLNFFRTHGQYLSPGDGNNLLTLFNAFLRGSILNLLVWIPFIAFIFYWLIGNGELPEIESPLEILNADKFVAFKLILQIGLVIVAVLFLILLVYSAVTWLSKVVKLIKNYRGFWLSKVFKPTATYKARLNVEKTATTLVLMALLLLLIGSLPIVEHYLKDEYASLGPIAVLGGAAILYKHFMALMLNAKVPTGILVNVGALLFLYGVLLLALQLALFVGQSDYGVLLLVIAITVGYFVNLNYIAIHRFYRDRLMETFMPDPESIDVNNENLNKRHYPAMKANKAYLKDFADLNNTNQIIGPYPIINTNAVFIGRILRS